MNSPWSPVFSALPWILTPLAVLLWKKLTPPAAHSEFDVTGREALARRNRALDGLFTLLSFVGLMSPMLVCLMLGARPSNPRFLIGMGLLSFGLMVVLPVSVIALLTLNKGVSRFREFWRFYEIKWGIGLRGIVWVYVPIALLAPIGLLMMLFSAGTTD